MDEISVICVTFLSFIRKKNIGNSTINDRKLKRLLATLIVLTKYDFLKLQKLETLCRILFSLKISEYEMQHHVTC